MKRRITVNINKNMLVWAAFRLLISNYGTEYRLSKAKVEKYLLKQIILFGCDEVSLMGENYFENINTNKRQYNFAKHYIEKSYKLID